MTKRKPSSSYPEDQSLNSRKYWKLIAWINLLLISILFIDPFYARTMNSKPIIIRIVFIEWDLQEKWFTITEKEYKLTEVTFSVDYQIENTEEEIITIEFANTNEKVDLFIIAELENQNLNLTVSGDIIGWPMITNRSYIPGVVNRSQDYSFRLNKTGLIQLPKGVYGIKPTLAGRVFPEKYGITSYGVGLEVSDRSYSLLYEHNETIVKSNFTTSTISGSTILSLASLFLVLLIHRRRLFFSLS